MTARIGFKIPTGAKGARLTAPISIPSNNSSQDSNRSYAKRRRALLSSFGEQSPLFSKRFPKKNAKLISQTRATPNLIEKCSRRDVSAGAEIRKRYQPHRGESPATYCFHSASPNLLLLRRCTRAVVYPGRALRLCLRLPRHAGGACAHESLQADRKRQTQAIHCCFG